jgi:cyclic pyranopterin phosphate synthase
MTTNGVLLSKFAAPLREAGISRLNISIDTLVGEKYREITRTGSLDDVLRGIEAAKAAGFTKIKLNMVLIGGFNDNEIPAYVALTRDEDIEVRFIELMPIGECSGWDKSRFISAETVLQAVPELEPAGTGGVAKLYKVKGYKGRVGLISPLSSCFCSACDRIRVTADGRLKPCLHSAEEIMIKGLHGAESGHR